jgi:hypothetical protein
MAIALIMQGYCTFFADTINNRNIIVTVLMVGVDILGMGVFIATELKNISDKIDKL